VEQILEQTSIADTSKKISSYFDEEVHPSLVADPVVNYMNKEQMEKAITATQQKMKQAAKELDFILAAQCRDELFELYVFK